MNEHHPHLKYCVVWDYFLQKVVAFCLGVSVAPSDMGPLNLKQIQILLVWYIKLGLVHCTYLGVSSHDLLRALVHSPDSLAYKMMYWPLAKEISFRYFYFCFGSHVAQLS